VEIKRRLKDRKKAFEGTMELRRTKRNVMVCKRRKGEES